ncbi:MAG: YdjY domain-containing protein [Planctomycetaceae bacterium]
MYQHDSQWRLLSGHLRPRRRLLLLTLVLGSNGCKPDVPLSSPRVETVPVTGTVLVDGKPEAEIGVIFLRVSDRQVDTAVPDPHGVTGPDGVITVGTYLRDDGGVPGEYKLLFVWPEPSSINHEMEGDRFQGRYINRETTPYQVTIPKIATDQPFDLGTIELTSTSAETAAELPSAPPLATDTDGPVPLNPQKTVLLDAVRKRVFLKSTVVLREGVLEMFACLAGSKEHESVVSVDTEAYVIHAALLAVGAEPGAPVEFDPEYRPPRGQTIDIFVNWTDENGRPHRETAQSWMRHVTRRYYIEPLVALPEGLRLPEDGELRYDEKRRELIWFGPMSETQREELLRLSDDAAYQSLVRKMFEDGQPRPIEADFVFAGSGFYEEEDGKRFYLAESGNLICVANFSDAIIDVAVKSLSSNDDLLFEPFTERIPPLGTEVSVELVPRLGEKEQPAADDAE